MTNKTTGPNRGPNQSGTGRTPGDQHYRSWVETPIGRLSLFATDAGLRAIGWEEETTTEEMRVPDLPSWDDITTSDAHPILSAATRQLDEYFAGQRCNFDLPLDIRGTEFQLLAWRALATITPGTTATYAEQAKRIGRPKAVRAVGTANGRNPLPIILPCHRVVGSGGGLGGYSGEGGLDTKRFLLEHERKCC